MQVSDEIGCLDIVLFNLCKLSVRICTRLFLDWAHEKCI